MPMFRKSDMSNLSWLVSSVRAFGGIVAFSANGHGVTCAVCHITLSNKAVMRSARSFRCASDKRHTLYVATATLSLQPPTITRSLMAARNVWVQRLKISAISLTRWDQ